MGSTRWLALLTAAACGPAPATTGPSAPEPAVAAPAATAAEGGPILWRVDGPNGASYLFGTVHLGVTASDIDPVVLEMLGACDTYVSEADLSEVNASQVLHLGTLPASQSLRQMLGEEAFAELGRQLGAPQLDRLRPWFAYVQVISRLFPTGVSLDQQLLQTARDSDKKLVFLENVNEQLELISRVIDASDLKQILDPESADRANLTALIEAYRRGDFATIEALIAGPEVVARDPAEFEQMFSARNAAWAPALAAELSRGKVFVAVGAGHFAGETGLLRLLAERGFKLSRVGPSTAR